MKRYDIINALIKRYGYETYLEIGLRWGRCFNNVVAKHKESVDIAHNPTYKMTSSEFFINHNNTYDIIFVDGNHEEYAALYDITMALSIMRPGGAVVVHDCNPPTIDDTALNKNGEVYKAFIRCRKIHNYNFCVVNTDHGCGVITEHPIVSGGNSVCLHADTWDYFDQNRVELLNLISPQEFLENH